MSLDECKCSCHYLKPDQSFKHVIPCCQTCSSCGKDKMTPGHGYRCREAKRREDALKAKLEKLQAAVEKWMACKCDTCAGKACEATRELYQVGKELKS